MTERPSRRRRRRVPALTVFLSAVALILALALFLVWDNVTLQRTSFEVRFPDLPDGFDGLRVAVLSDFHGAVFGEDNEKLFDAVRSQSPDIIAVLGDLVDSDTEDPLAYADAVGRGLSAIAPVYYVTGNHEWAAGGVKELKQVLRDAGVTVLSNRAVTLERDGDTLLIAGIDDPNGLRDQKTPEDVFADLGAGFKILLAHRNDRFAGQYSRLGAELVLSGHAHGGLVRLPFTDGLVDSNRRFLPSYTSGLYRENGSTLFVTRGLGNSGRTFRVFNRPEAALLTLRKGT